MSDRSIRHKGANMAGPTDMIEGNKLVTLELIVLLRSFPVKFRSSH